MSIEADKIGQAITDNHGTINQFIGTSPHKSLPNSIPSSQSFVGREEYLNELRESYKKGSCSFVLHGTGGVGKTALALQFAKEIAGEYQAKVFVEMQGVSKTPLSTREVMLNIVRQFEREIPVNIEDSQLKSLYTQLLQNQSTLIVLDDAKSEEQVASLMNVKGSCFVISSRNYIGLTSGVTKRLSAMSPEDAESLLISIAGRDKFEGKAGDLAKMAGYLPMALKPLAKLLKNKFRTINEILRDYEDKKNFLKLIDTENNNLSIDASFALSYEVLPQNLQEAWRRLSVFPADFDKQSASTVFGTEFDEGWDNLRLLYDYSLIEEDTTSTNENPRFKLHELAREFADNQLSEDERYNAQLRHSFYYTLILRLANDLESNDRKNGFIKALELIDIEWTNILTGQDWAAKHLEKDDEAAELCADYAGIVTDLLALRLTPREEIVWFKAGLAAAHKFQNIKAIGFFLMNLGKSYSNLGKYETALSYLEESLNISHSIGDKKNEIACLGNLGNIYFHQKDIRKAASFSKRAVNIAYSIDDLNSQCIHLNNLGIAFLGSDNRFANIGKRLKRSRPLWWYQRAFAYFEAAREIADQIGNLEVASGSRSNIGRIFLGSYNLKSIQKAGKYFEEALAIQRKIKNPFGIAISLANLGSLYLKTGKREKACKVWRESQAIFQSIESPYAGEINLWIENNCRKLQEIHVINETPQLKLLN